MLRKRRASNRGTVAYSIWSKCKKKLSDRKHLIKDIGHKLVEGGYYETAQICINGHVIPSGIESSKSSMQEFCEDCGKPTIIKCLIVTLLSEAHIGA